MRGGSIERGRRLLVFAACVGFIAGCSEPARQPTPSRRTGASPIAAGTVGERLVAAKVTVVNVDLQNRLLTLRGPDGRTLKVRVSEKVVNLPQVKVGDEVSVRYYESLAYRVFKPGDAEPGTDAVATGNHASPGERPSIAGAASVSLTGTITALDRSAPSVTLRAPDGTEDTIRVRDPHRLDAVNVDDLVEISYSEALAISVDKPRKR